MEFVSTSSGTKTKDNIFVDKVKIASATVKYDTKEDWQEFCLEVYQNEAPTLAYTTEEQFEIICSLDDRIPPIGNLAEIDLIQEIEAFLRPVLDGLRDRKELKSIIGIDRMSHQDAQTFKKIADEINSTYPGQNMYKQKISRIVNRKYQGIAA